MMNCTPTLKFIHNGELQILKGSETDNEFISIDEMILNILSKNNGLKDSEWWVSEFVAGPITIESIDDLKHVASNTTLNKLKSSLKLLDKDYKPVYDNLSNLINKIKELGTPRILHTSSVMLLNGSNLPNYVLGNSIFEDLIIINSNNPAKIYEVLLEYYYTRSLTINNDDVKELKNIKEKKLQLLGLEMKDIIIFARNNYALFKDYKSKPQGSQVQTIVYTILHDKQFGKMLDIIPGKNKKTARLEIFDLLNLLTSNVISNSNESYDEYSIPYSQGDEIKIFNTRSHKNIKYDITLFLITQFYSRQQNKTDDTKIHLPMSSEYGEFASNKIKSKSTFEAIVNDEKTAFTVNSTMKNYQEINDLKVGDKIQFFRGKDTVTVKITSIREINASDALNSNFIDEWVKAEGYSSEYFKDKIISKINSSAKVKQITFKMDDSLYTGTIADNAKRIAEKIILGKTSEEQILKIINEFYGLCNV